MGAYTIDIDGEDFHYYGPYTENLDGMMMTITVTIGPWNSGNSLKSNTNSL